MCRRVFLKSLIATDPMFELIFISLIVSREVFWEK